MKTKKIKTIDGGNTPMGYPQFDYKEAFDEVYEKLGTVEYWQIKMAHILMLPKAMRPPKEKTAVALGLLNTVAYDNWARHPKILEIKKILTKRYFKDSIPDILLAMQNNALMGDVPAAKLFLQYVDDFTVDEQKQIQNNINVTPEELSVILGNLKNKKI